ncbi:VOC family protein [Portibacter lacus]|uniref:VOC domain-containing protein n=1 Tax=Portibacter lacus TaxID=1099794 RepID=A0AA37WF82_9BACT|nr:VOC family protein [Portibacter lacus]GLR18252.1 hypothetical protein GCM10007940_28680 [Portibacter lacus]
MKNAFFIILIFFSIQEVAAQTVPDQYKNVDQLIWVVNNLDRTINGWKNFGFDEVTKFDTVSVHSGNDKASFKALCAKANLGGAQITWIQPLDQNSIFAEFLKEYGDGVMSIVHRLNGQYELNREISRLNVLGVSKLDEITITTSKGVIYYVFLDTYQKGKYVLGLSCNELDQNYFSLLSNENSNNLVLSQYAFAIEDETQISNYWHKLGLPRITSSPISLRKTVYHNERTDFKVNLGWQLHGAIPYEWVIPKKLPTIHMDHIQKHGEGFHHLGFDIKEIEPVLRYFKKQEIDIISEGAWGDENKPGSGEFMYMDTDKYGGVILELIWKYKEN